MSKIMNNEDMDPKRVDQGEIESFLKAIRKIKGKKIITLNYANEIAVFIMDEFGLIGYDDTHNTTFRTMIENAMLLVGGLIITSFTETLVNDLPKQNVCGVVFNENTWFGLDASGALALYRMYIYAITKNARSAVRNVVLVHFPSENNVVFVDFRCDANKSFPVV